MLSCGNAFNMDLSLCEIMFNITCHMLDTPKSHRFGRV